MPELPEVETVRRDIAGLYAGDRLEALTVSGARTVRRHPPGLLSALSGQLLVGARRHGKYLLLDWESGACLVVHLRMSGQLLAEIARPGAGAHPAHTHAVFQFARHGALLFVDPRTFGELFLPSALAGGGVPPPHARPGSEVLPAGMAHLGPDALTLTHQHLAAVAAGRRTSVKALLADQVALAGVGNIYSDEICWHAKVSPATPSGVLKPAQLRRLVASTHEVLGAAIEARGSTLSDEQYCDIYGKPGSYQLQHGAYGQSTCRRCGTGIVRRRCGPRMAYCCPRCQR